MRIQLSSIARAVAAIILMIALTCAAAFDQSNANIDEGAAQEAEQNSQSGTDAGAESEVKPASSEEDEVKEKTASSKKTKTEKKSKKRVKRLRPAKTVIKGFDARHSKKYRQTIKDKVTVYPAYGREIILKRYDAYLKKWVEEKRFKTPARKYGRVLIKYPGTWRATPKSYWKIVVPRAKRRNKDGVVIQVMKKTATGNARVNVRKFHYAGHAVVYDVETGKCLYAYGATSKTYIASMRKMMTGVLLDEHKKPGSRITVRGLGHNTITMGLRSGDVVRAKDLMHAMFLPSSNDAASAAAMGVGGSYRNFIRMMNKKARRIGMKRTRYSSPVGDGLDPRSSTTVYDQALLGKYIMTSPTTKYLRSVLRKKSYSFTSLKYRIHYNKKKLHRGNRLLGTKYRSIGIKTGYNAQARWCFCNAWKYKGKLYISVVTNNPTRKKRWDSVKALTRFTKFQVDRGAPEITVK